MISRTQILVEQEVISEEDAKTIILISTPQGEDDLSLLELTNLKSRLESYLRSTTDKDKIKLYSGMIKLVEKYTKDFTEGQTKFRIT